MKMLSTNRFVFYSVLCLLIILLQTALSQRACQTPKLADGLCVPYNQCTFITRTVERYGTANLPAVFRRYVEKSRCAGTSKIGESLYCCENRFLAFQPTTVTPTHNTADLRPTNEFEAKLNANGVAILNRQGCGSNNGNRIAFGKEVNLAEFPWMALLRYGTNGSSRAFKCGGTLITDRYVLSAAHCVAGSKLKLIGVRLGEHNLDTDQDCQKRGNKTYCTPSVEDYGIERTIPHPDFNPRLMVNDILLVKLDRTVTFKEHIVPICLPTTQSATEIAEDQDYIVAGWGVTEESSASSILLKAVVPHQTTEACQNAFKRIRITDVHVCAGGVGGVDACRGDSGGPLFFIGRGTTLYVQYGIVSFGGVDCGADTNLPGVYANVTHFMPWITANID